MTTPSPEVVGLMVRLGDALGRASRPASLSVELRRAVVNTRALFSAAACSCALVEPDDETLRFVAADGIGAAEIVGVTLPAGTGIAGWVMMSGQPIMVADVGADSRFARDVALRTHYLPRTIIAAPLTDESGAVLGVLEVLDPATREADSGRDLDLMGVVAAFTASIVGLAGVYDALGTALIGALVGASNDAEFAAALAEIAPSPTGGPDLRALASSFHELASVGPDGAALAQQIVHDVAAFVAARGRQ
jgi:signal transduction protein with GAF and PtsI domain